MASDVNVVALSGRLTRDPELKATAGGSSVLTLPVAFNGSRKAQDGSWEDVAGYVDVAVFGGRAEALAGFLRKGARVMVSGRLRWESWQGKDGQRRTSLSVVADEVVAPRGEAPTQAPCQAPTQAPCQAPAQAPTQGGAQTVAFDASVYGDEIPF